MLATDKMSVVQEDDVPRPTCRLKPKSVLPHVRRTSCPSSARSGIRHRVAIAVRSPGRRLRLGGKRGRRCRRCRVGFDRGEPPHVRRTSCPSSAPSPSRRTRFEQRMSTSLTCSRRTRCPSYKRRMQHDRTTDSCRHPFAPCTTDILSVARSVVRSVDRPETAIRAAGEHGFDMLATDKMSVVHGDDVPRSKPTRQSLHPLSSFTAEP